MTDRDMQTRVQQVFANTLSGVTDDPYMARRVLNAARERPGRHNLPGRRVVLIVLVICLLLTATVGVAWSVSRQYFTEIARMTVTSGDYEDWSPKEKRYMVQIMGKYGLIPEGEAKALARLSEGEIDAFMLERYGAESASDDLGWISINRIAFVELGDYTHWPNETWVWFTEMMLETGLWDRTNDIDIYYTPGEEAVPPETAVENARLHLLERGVPKEMLDSAQIIWHYFTNSADTARSNLRYLVTFLYPDQSEDHVSLLPDGTAQSSW